MKIGFVTQWFPPEHAIIPEAIQRSLVARGHTVRTLTGVPHYPSGRTLSGYSAWRWARGTRNGAPVLHTPEYPSHDQRPLPRMTTYISWAMSATLSSWWLAKSDILLVYSSPATSAIPALVLRAVRGRPYVLHIQDLWPDSVTSAGMMPPGIALKGVAWALNHFMRVIYQGSRHIVVSSPGMQQILVDRGVPQTKISIVYNWTDEEMFRPVVPTTDLRKRLSLPSSSLIMLYAGNFGPAQDLGPVVRAVGRARADAHLLLVGDGVDLDLLQREAQEHAPGRVHFLGRIPADDIPELCAASDISIVSLAPHGLFKSTVPSKVQSLLASGAIILCRALGDAAAIVEAAGGICVDPSSIASLVEAIDFLAGESKSSLQERRVKAREYYFAHLSESVNAVRLEKILRAEHMR